LDLEDLQEIPDPVDLIIKQVEQLQTTKELAMFSGVQESAHKKVIVKNMEKDKEKQNLIQEISKMTEQQIKEVCLGGTLNKKTVVELKE